ncbi:hypothetical protein R5R35_008329 [Gryllus longicercus]|uniref:MD-2-related lipid-recognition domain-containing protein n=1 Tax=Gryllus longicercus TaxID=2509291 RepID=A0AAN9V5T7_9ORTH
MKPTLETQLTQSALVVVVLLLLLVETPQRCEGAGLSLAGPYKLVLREFLACDDQGAHTLRFDLRRRLLDSGLPAYSGKVTFPQDLDNDVKGRVDIAQWGQGGWAPNAYNHKSRHLCRDLRRMAPGYFQSLTQALKLPARCPLPKGTYSVADWQVGMSVPFPALPYGLYRIDVSYSNASALLGCVRWVLECKKR